MKLPRNLNDFFKDRQNKTVPIPRSVCRRRKSVLLNTDETNVVVVSLGHIHRLEFPNEVWICLGTGKDERILNLGQMSKCPEPEKFLAIPVPLLFASKVGVGASQPMLRKLEEKQMVHGVPLTDGPRLDERVSEGVEWRSL